MAVGIRKLCLFLFLSFTGAERSVWAAPQMRDGPVGMPANQQVALVAPQFPPVPLPSQQQIIQRHVPEAVPPIQSYEAQIEPQAFATETKAAQDVLSSSPSSASRPPVGTATAAVTQFPVTIPAVPQVQFNLAFAIPGFIMKIARMVAGMAAALGSIGIPGIPDVNVCGKAPILKELMLCVQNHLLDVKSIFLVGKEVASLNMRVMSGGRTANAALTRLKTLWSMPYAKLLMKAMGTVMVCQMLMQRESSPDRQRWEAGSLVTLITDLPVATVIADAQTGGFGHVNVVVPRPSRIHMPDKVIKELNEGVDPIDTQPGPLSESEGRDDLENSPPI